jgi:hypothetical protein
VRRCVWHRTPQDKTGVLFGPGRGVTKVSRIIGWLLLTLLVLHDMAAWESGTATATFVYLQLFWSCYAIAMLSKEESSAG